MNHCALAGELGWRASSASSDFLSGGQQVESVETMPLSIGHSLLNVPSCIMLVDTASGQVQFPNMDHFFAYQPSDFPDFDHFCSRIHPQDQAHFFDCLSAAAAAHQIETMLFQNKCGAWEPVQYAIYPYTTLLAPAAASHLIILVPLSQLKLVTKIILENESKYRGLVNQAPMGIVIIDESGRVVEWNTAMQRITGYTFQEMRARHIWQIPQDLLSKADTSMLDGLFEDRIRKALGGAQATFLGETIPITVISRLGEERRVQATFFPIPSADGILLGMLAQDITEQTRAEEKVLQQIRQAEAVARLTSRVNAALNVDPLLEVVCSEIVETLNVQYATVQLYDKASDSFLVRKVQRQNGGTIDPRFFQPIPRSAFLAQRDRFGPVLLFDDVRLADGIASSEVLEAIDLRTVVVVGIEHNNDLIGTLTVATTGTTRQFRLDEITLLQIIADQCAQAITRARLFEQIQAGRKRMQRLSKKLVEVQESERRMLARELHDEIGQELTALVYALETSKRIEGEAQTQLLTEAQSMVYRLMDEVREMSIRLRPTVLDDLGLGPALTWLFDRFQNQTGIRVQATLVNMNDRFDSNIETTAFRVMQEALTNVARYAGVQQVETYARFLDGRLDVQVSDSGRGFDVNTVLNHEKAFGLSGMVERVSLVGGQLEILSEPGKGTSVRALFPIKRTVERREYERQNIPGG